MFYHALNSCQFKLGGEGLQFANFSECQGAKYFTSLYISIINCHEDNNIFRLFCKIRSVNGLEERRTLNDIINEPSVINFCLQCISQSEEILSNTFMIDLFFKLLTLHVNTYVLLLLTSATLM